MTTNIANLTREEYFNDVDLVTSRAIAAGIKGKAYEHYQVTSKGPKKGRYNGKVTIKYRPLNTGDLFEFGKADHRKAVAEAIAAGIPVRLEVLLDYPDLIASGK